MGVIRLLGGYIPLYFFQHAACHLNNFILSFKINNLR